MNMNVSNYHVLKESQEKKVNKAIQLIRKNNFTEEQKENWITGAMKLVTIIRKQRQIVYLDTEEVEQKFEDYNPEAESNEVLVIVVDDLTQVKHQVADLLNSVILDEKLVTIESLVATRTVKESFDNPKMGVPQNRDSLVYGKVKDVEAYKDLSVELFSNCSDGISIMIEPEQEDLPGLGENMKRETVIDEPVVNDGLLHKLTQEDFDNNPELNNMGLNVGDEVSIPVGELVNDWKQKNGQEAGIGETRETPPAENKALSDHPVDTNILDNSVPEEAKEPDSAEEQK